jgi:hypothetical protein
MNGVVKLNGLFDRPEIQPGHERVYTKALEGYSDLRLRFSQTVSRPLPRTLAALRKVLAAVYLPLAASDPKAADGELALEWRANEAKGWSIGIAKTTDSNWIPGSLFSLTHGKDGLKNVGEARGKLEFVLQYIEAEWLAHRKALWVSLISAERIANQHMALHLMHSEERLEEVSDDYVGLPDLIDKIIVEPADRIRALIAVSQSPTQKKRFMSLVAALVELREMRGKNDLEALLRQRSVLGAAATMASLLPIMVAAGISPSAPDAIEDLKQLAKDANQRGTDALLSYIAKMRALAAEHPVLTVLHHITERPMSESSIQQSVMNAVKAVRGAIDALANVMDTPVIPALDSKGIAPGATKLVKAMAKASKLSIWKLPIFVDRALLELPEDERLPILAMREAAFEDCKEELAVRELAMNAVSAVETAIMLIPAARVAGLVLSLAIGLAQLKGGIKSYDETTTLYHASLDPGFLALGDAAHEPADASMMVFDLAAVALDIVGVGKAARAF